MNEPASPKPKLLSKFRKNPTTISTLPNRLSRILTNDTVKSDVSTVSSEASIDTTTTVASQPAKRFFRVRSHSNSNDIIIPVVKKIPERDPEKLREIKDIAFEVNMTEGPKTPATKYVHPLDQPFQTAKKRLFPGNSNEPNDQSTAAASKDLLEIVLLLANFVCRFLMAVWNLDLFVNIATSQETTTRLHIPSLALIIVVLYAVSSATISSPPSSNYQHYYQPQRTQSAFFASRIVNFLVISGLLSIVVIKLKNGISSVPEELESEEPNEEEKTVQDETKLVSLALNPEKPYNRRRGSSVSPVRHVNHQPRRRSSNALSPVKITNPAITKVASYDDETEQYGNARKSPRRNHPTLAVVEPIKNGLVYEHVYQEDPEEEGFEFGKSKSFRYEGFVERARNFHN